MIFDTLAGRKGGGNEKFYKSFFFILFEAFINFPLKHISSPIHRIKP